MALEVIVLGEKKQVWRVVRDSLFQNNTCGMTSLFVLNARIPDKKF